MHAKFHLGEIDTHRLLPKECVLLTFIVNNLCVRSLSVLNPVKHYLLELLD